MNTAAFAHLLRHLLFLFFTLKLMNGIIMIIMSENCKRIFDSNEMLPINTLAPRHAIYITIDFMSSFINGLGFVIIVASLIGFVAATYLYKYPLLNFSAGMVFLCTTPMEFASGLMLSNMVSSFRTIIRKKMDELFDTSNNIDPERLKQYAVNGDSFSAEVSLDGWNKVYEGSRFNHANVDYMHWNLGCCGLTGRQYWVTTIPRSCCSQNFQGYKCTLSVAHSNSCLYYYDSFKQCLNTLRIECFCFAILSLFTALDALYLAYLRVRYPTGNYNTDSSDSSEEDEEY
ncbi:hypothetical protein MTP99_016062 [Tenebrio molitor]|nr:hypothetical protein MTP99_016062 [Tenebrio molitor]